VLLNSKQSKTSANNHSFASGCSKCWGLWSSVPLQVLEVWVYLFIQHRLLF